MSNIEKINGRHYIEIGKILLEMSVDKQQLTKLLFGLEYTLSEHLLKLIIFEKCRDTNKWKVEIAGYLMKIQKPKVIGLNKIKLEKLYYDFLFDKFSENASIGVVFTDLIDEYKNYKLRKEFEKGFNYKVAYRKLGKFFKEVCRRLTNRTLTHSTIYELIDVCIL